MLVSSISQRNPVSIRADRFSEVTEFFVKIIIEIYLSARTITIGDIQILLFITGIHDFLAESCPSRIVHLFEDFIPGAFEQLMFFWTSLALFLVFELAFLNLVDGLRHEWL